MPGEPIHGADNFVDQDLVNPEESTVVHTEIIRRQRQLNQWEETKKKERERERNKNGTKKER